MDKGKVIFITTITSVFLLSAIIATSLSSTTALATQSHPLSETINTNLNMFSNITSVPCLFIERDLICIADNLEVGHE